MTIIPRQIEPQIRANARPGKVLVISGARRVGKTVLIRQILKKMDQPYLLLNGEDINTQTRLAHRSVENYRQFLGSKKLLVIDEAQRIPEVGLILKLIIDEIRDMQVIVTGSSAFDVYNQTGEPLTGRKQTYYLFPLSESEYEQFETEIEHPDKLKQRLVYGNYPELTALPDQRDQQDYLNEIVNSYLLKDILLFENIRNSTKVFNLLRLVAYQIGREVSNQELGRQLAISKNTVEKYLDLLSKVFVIHKVGAFSRNLRKEISKSSRWYFYDNGLRNALIANFNPVEIRNDLGMLWENYIVAERIKSQVYRRITVNNYFWRTYDKQEIDWVEERGGKLYGYEFKWSRQQSKVPPAWTKTYPEAEYKVITPRNYRSWLLP